MEFRIRLIQKLALEYYRDLSMDFDVFIDHVKNSPDFSREEISYINRCTSTKKKYYTLFSSIVNQLFFFSFLKRGLKCITN